MNKIPPRPLSRRQFAGSLAVGLAAPMLLGGVTEPATVPPQKEEKTSPPGAAGKAAAPEPSEEEKTLKRLRDFNLPADTEPAFVFQALARHPR